MTTETETPKAAPEKKGWSIWTLLIVGLILTLIVCGGVGTVAYNAMFAAPTPPPVVAEAGPSCSPPAGASLSWFHPNGEVPVTDDPVDAEGGFTLRYCDGEMARAVRVLGAKPGKSRNWQGLVMVDEHNQVVYIQDLATTSTTRVKAAPHLVGVTKRCVQSFGSGCNTPGT